MTLIIHEGKKSEGFFLRDDNFPDPSSTYKAEFNIFNPSSSANYRVEIWISGTKFPILV